MEEVRLDHCSLVIHRPRVDMYIFNVAHLKVKMMTLIMAFYAQWTSKSFHPLAGTTSLLGSLLITSLAT